MLTATSADAQQKGLDAVGDTVQKAYKAAKGMESVTFFADPTTLATVKLKPFMKGPPDQRIYKVSEPKK